MKIKKILTSLVSVYTDAKATSDIKAKNKALEDEKKEIDRTSINCPHCNEKHLRAEIESCRTRDWIRFSDFCRVNFIKCKKCEKVSLVRKYAKGVLGTVVFECYSLEDKKENKDV